MGTNSRFWDHGIQWCFFVEIFDWLIWRTFWGVRLWCLIFWESDPALSGSVPFFFSYCQFSCGKNRRDEVAGLLAVLQSKLSISLLSKLVSSWATEPSLLLACMSSLQNAWTAFTSHSTGLTTWMFSLEWSPHTEASWPQLRLKSQNSGAWVQGEGLQLLAQDVFSWMSFLSMNFKIIKQSFRKPYTSASDAVTVQNIFFTHVTC